MNNTAEIRITVSGSELQTSHPPIAAWKWNSMRLFDKVFVRVDVCRQLTFPVATRQLTRVTVASRFLSNSHSPHIIIFLSDVTISQTSVFLSSSSVTDVILGRLTVVPPPPPFIAAVRTSAFHSSLIISVVSSVAAEHETPDVRKSRGLNWTNQNTFKAD